MIEFNGHVYELTEKGVKGARAIVALVRNQMAEVGCPDCNPDDEFTCTGACVDVVWQEYQDWLAAGSPDE
jgi:hypothetical protein